MLTEAEIKRLIDDDALSERKRFAAVGQRYYEGEHDILNYRMFYYNTDGELVEDKARSNSRICHPFFTEHVDQLAAYILSFEENPIQAKPIAEGLQDHLDEYFDDEFWAEMQELITGTNAKGFDYLYGYKNHEDRLAFQHADSLGVVEVRAKDTDDGCEYIIYWYVDRINKDNQEIKRIEVWNDKETTFFKQVNNFGQARIWLQLIHPGSLKPVHAAPAMLLVLGVLLLIASFFCPWLLMLPLLYALLIFTDSLLKNKSLKVAVLSVMAAAVQITGYGMGFLKALWFKMILKQPLETKESLTKLYNRG